MKARNGEPVQYSSVNPTQGTGRTVQYVAIILQFTGGQDVRNASIRRRDNVHVHAIRQPCLFNEQRKHAKKSRKRRQRRRVQHNMSTAGSKV